MRYLKVNLWGNEIGRLVWDAKTRRCYFMFNPDLKEPLPDIAPLISPSSTRNVHLPVMGDDRPIYQGLPPFIADSLPDSWGNTLFDRWAKDNKVPRNKITPLYKLMFIGQRGMGALEYEPFAPDLADARQVDIKSLYDLSLKILEERNEAVLDSNDQLTMQALLAVGSSAGGRQMKAIIAINPATGEIRSGQADNLEGFEYYILKFGDQSLPLAEIETTYYRMARLAGINIEESRLLTVEGVNHFLTKRFDRKNGKKIHLQTLAAINPEARSYEDLLATCRELAFPETDINQLYTLMVFNVLANNTDDHNKNFSFLLEQDSTWKLAPAYDVTFIFNSNGTGPNTEHRLSICGKTSQITLSDLIDFANRNGIENPRSAIDKVTAALANFNALATECRIPNPWRSIIHHSLLDNLRELGLASSSDAKSAAQTDCYGREISEVMIAINSKGHYVVSALIDGHRRRVFIRQNMPFYSQLNSMDAFNLSPTDSLKLIESLFPPH